VESVKSRDMPDIVVVVFDTARWDRFGCYGYGRPTTPTVDSLADEGTLVERMIANGPWTLPSHGSLFSGLYPSQHGSQWQTGPQLSDSVEVTMAEWLRSLGYHTICATNNGLISPRTGLARGFDRYASRLDLERGLRRIRRRLEKVLFGGDSGGRVVNDWLRHEVPQHSGPLFLFVNYLECHWAYVPPRRFERQVGGPRFGPMEGLRYRTGLARRAGPWESIARADQRTLEIYSTLYDGELANADNHLTELMDILATSGRLSEGQTLLIVTSDHGEHVGEHGLADHHASVDDHLVRVPFVAWGPGVVPRGRTRGIHEFVDVLPSMATLLETDIPAQYLGERRTGLFTADDDADARPYAFAEWRAWTEKEAGRLAKRNPSFDYTGLGQDLVCVRDNEWKLVRSADGAEALFHVESDPAEEVDLCGSAPEIVQRLRKPLDEALAAWGAWQQPEQELSDVERQEIEAHLSQLGYI
jgi:arylsulfatase A-like enzyme